MLLLSARAGALAERVGPRVPMTLGPVVCAGALLLLARIGAGASYARTVLPAVGLSLMVAPLTATALGSTDEKHAGIASGVNNAVARAAGLLAVAVRDAEAARLPTLGVSGGLVTPASPALCARLRRS